MIEGTLAKGSFGSVSVVTIDFEQEKESNGQQKFYTLDCDNCNRNVIAYIKQVIKKHDQKEQAKLGNLKKKFAFKEILCEADDEEMLERYEFAVRLEYSRTRHLTDPYMVTHYALVEFGREQN